jgi:hypothetical protein
MRQIAIRIYLTIADALYYAGEPSVRRAKGDRDGRGVISAILADELAYRSVSNDERSISVVCDDPTRTLEALHFELVSTAYRHAIGSNYTLDLPHRRDVDTGTTIMTDRYHAPFILGRFRPHFSLLTNMANERREEALARIREQFEQKVPRREIEVTELALMQQPALDAPWQIEQEIRLGTDRG